MLDCLHDHGHDFDDDHQYLCQIIFLPSTEVFYPDTKEFLVHEYQFMMSKAASQETFNKTITFINHYSSSSEK